MQFLKYLLQYNSLYYFDPPCILPLLMYAKLQSSDGASELPTLFSPMYIIYCHLPDREFLILRLWRFFSFYAIFGIVHDKLDNFRI